MLDESRDVTVRTGAYVTADETTRIKATKAVTLQRFFEARATAAAEPRSAAARRGRRATPPRRLRLRGKQSVMRVCSRSSDVCDRGRRVTSSCCGTSSRRGGSRRWRKSTRRSRAPVEAEARERRRRRGRTPKNAGRGPLRLGDARRERRRRCRRRGCREGETKNAMADLLAKETKMLLAIERLRARRRRTKRNACATRWRIWRLRNFGKRKRRGGDRGHHAGDPSARAARAVRRVPECHAPRARGWSCCGTSSGRFASFPRS